eukprot:TRINITY_DN24510_c0_g1_i1.p1 TRINITY_DN24510_c0_g1~~TRINITY_DN24510_c0_g1_i1.p1  ORF type:complete len:561 (+),score=81.16 TRINITY_DN24510_c0_g1_i1:123-1805(+)
MRALIPLLTVLWTSSATPLTVVDAGGIDTSMPLVEKAAVLTCVGLMNRKGPLAFGIYDDSDKRWLNITEHMEAKATIDSKQFLLNCFENEAKGYILYNMTSQRALFPTLTTVAAVEDGVPVDASLLQQLFPTQKPPLVFNAVSSWAGKSAAEVTKELHTKYVQNTTALAFTNPGYDNHKHQWNPPLTGYPDVGLTDFIVKKKLFTIYLVDACIPLTTDYSIMSDISTNNPWPRPITVYGYNNAWPLFGGDLFEAETDCVREHNLGQVASDGLSSLSFYSSKPSITMANPLKQNPIKGIEFNKSKTYIGYTVGDGDNLSFIKGSRLDWFQKRIEKCATGEGCFPLLWTISPHTLDVAPDWAHVYYNMSYQTGSDYFILPPSGHLYSYPGMMPSDMQVDFVNQTEHDCLVMNMSVSVTWEWFYDWETSINNYMPRYSKNNIVKALVPVSVPYNMPMLAFKEDEFFRVLGVDKNVVLFRQREWRGSGPTSVPGSKKNYLTPQEMADEINNYPQGTVSAIYLTSDGGANLDSYYNLTKLLGEHVQIVDHENLAAMALSSYHQSQ